MKKIELTKGEFALVDDEDYGYLNKFKWKCSTEGYAITNFQINTNKRKSVSMHRLIFNPFTELIIDHKNCDKLDNRKINLRIVSSLGNCRNRKPSNGKTSAYKGVGWHKRGRRWQARITVNGKLIYLGGFDKEKDAADAYDAAAKKYFGEHAWKKFRSNQ